ncbi:MAG: hypothetical protein JO072_01480 [Parafilimonas sp.]|nr:hypothetical protein [Parafilimonas sp.]
MKTLLLSCFAVLFFIILKAQPVLQAADLNPVAGDKFNMVPAKTIGVAVPKDGQTKPGTIQILQTAMLLLILSVI